MPNMIDDSVLLEGVLDELAALADHEVDRAALYALLQSYSTMSKTELVQTLCDKR